MRLKNLATALQAAQQCRRLRLPGRVQNTAERRALVETIAAEGVPLLVSAASDAEDQLLHFLA